MVNRELERMWIQATVSGLRYHPTLIWRVVENDDKPQSGQSMSQPRLEADTSRIQVRSNKTLSVISHVKIY
jgi:hypothetical protein